MKIRTVRHPGWSWWRRKEVTVFTPDIQLKKAPVIFFCHGFGGTEWDGNYNTLIRWAVDCGYVVVYSPYQTIDDSVMERYEQLFEGFKAGVSRYGFLMDLTRVCYMGHSFGAGALPWIAQTGKARGWGSFADTIFSMAPWYSYGVLTGTLNNRFLWDNTVFYGQCYKSDASNSFKMMLDIFDNIEALTKAYTYVDEAQAEHDLPTERGDSVVRDKYILQPMKMILEDRASVNDWRHDFPVPLPPETQFRWKWVDPTNPRA